MRDLADELLKAKVKARLFGGDPDVQLGRLVILDRLGIGGMGTVFAAYDPRLDRRVAVKVLHAGDADANARSLREARALAKLVHPNVIAIHDADEVDGQVYIVMELASGTPLRAWLRHERSWRDVVRVLREAAAGLAAAHRAGVTHRDIKPDNIVVGEDGTRIVDFGLATDDTRDGELAGTPRYMAPEAQAGAAATAASDQFSFGKTLAESLEGRDAPSWLHAIVKRMTAEDPAARFVSMDAVVARLSRDRRRVQVIAVVAGAALLVGGTVGFVAGGDAVDRCKPPREPNPAFAANAAAWRASYRAVCESKQPDRLLELRMRCLDRAIDRHDSLAAAVGGSLSPAERAEAASAIAQLPDPDACRTITDANELVLPTDPAQRARAIEGERALDAAWAQYALGRYRDARTRVVDVEAAAKSLDAPGLHAELAVLAATIEARIGEPAAARAKLEAALAATARARAHALEHAVWMRVLRHELFAGTPQHVLDWEPFARAAALRANLDGAELDGILGETLRDAGRLADARSRLTRALASRDPLRGDQRAIIEMNLGSTELALGHSTRAKAAFDRALDLASRQLGERHPSLAIYRDKLAEAERARGRIAAALAHHDASIALRTEVYGATDRSVATALLHRAETLLEAGQLAKAETDLSRAREIREQLFGATSNRLGEIDLVLADVELARGRTAESKTLRDRAIQLDPRLAAHALACEEDAEDPSCLLARADARAALDAAPLYRAALTALADEPSRMRLHALRGLAKTDAAIAAHADALAKQMPEFR